MWSCASVHWCKHDYEGKFLRRDFLDIGNIKYYRRAKTEVLNSERLKPYRPWSIERVFSCVCQMLVSIYSPKPVERWKAIASEMLCKLSFTASIELCNSLFSKTKLQTAAFLGQEVTSLFLALLKGFFARNLALIDPHNQLLHKNVCQDRWFIYSTALTHSSLWMKRDKRWFSKLRP